MIAQLLLLLALAGPKTAQCSVCHTLYARGEILTEARFETVFWSAVQRSGTTISRSGMRDARSICKRESGFQINCRDPRSSAYGLWGFLNSTWRDQHRKRTDCPVCQTRAFLDYCRERYGSIQGALSFHRRHGFY